MVSVWWVLGDNKNGGKRYLYIDTGMGIVIKNVLVNVAGFEVGSL